MAKGCLCQERWSAWRHFRLQSFTGACCMNICSHIEYGCPCPSLDNRTCTRSNQANDKAKKSSAKARIRGCWLLIVETVSGHGSTLLTWWLEILYMLKYTRYITACMVSFVAVLEYFFTWGFVPFGSFPTCWLTKVSLGFCDDSTCFCHLVVHNKAHICAGYTTVYIYICINDLDNIKYSRKCV